MAMKDRYTTASGMLGGFEKGMSQKLRIDLSWLPRKKRGVSMPPDVVGICNFSFLRGGLPRLPRKRHECHVTKIKI
ncbi:MAG: hypothetical protein K8S55_07165 [Phycisphaerae bacterium]|nr:hypothetical protein [Phycisphaerae bacterium]